MGDRAPRGRTAGFVGAGISLASGAAGAILRYLGEDPPLRWNDALAAFALGVAVALPGLITLASIHEDRPALLVAAALIALPLALLSFVMLIPLLVSAIFLVISVARGRVRVLGGRPLAGVAVAAVLGMGAFVMLFATDDPVCWTKLPNGSTVEVPADRSVRDDGMRVGSGVLPPGTVESGCSSDSITPAEAGASLVLSIGAITLPTRVASPPSA